MAVKIRLSRLGATNRPFYRVIATDARNKRDGAILANIGTFDPIRGSVIQFHEDLYQTWISQGAIPSDSAKKVYRMFKKSGIAAQAADVAIAESAMMQQPSNGDQAN